MSAGYSAAMAAVGSSDIASPPEVDLPRLLQMASATGRRSDPDVVILRNFGSKPLRLHAEMLAEGGNRVPGAGYWHEIAIYSADDGQVAVALRLLRSETGDLGVHRAKLFDDIGAAATWLEQFDTSVDLAADFDVADRQLSTACVTLKAASLRERAERLDRGYRGLVGEILYRLELDR